MSWVCGRSVGPSEDAPLAHGRSSSRAAPSAWHWTWVQGHRHLVSKQLRTPSRQKEEASGCIPCLPLTTAQLFLIRRRCSDPGAIQSPVRSGPPSDHASLRTGLQPAGFLVPARPAFLAGVSGARDLKPAAAWSELSFGERQQDQVGCRERNRDEGSVDSGPGSSGGGGAALLTVGSRDPWSAGGPCVAPIPLGSLHLSPRASPVPACTALLAPSVPRGLGPSSSALPQYPADRMEMTRPRSHGAAPSRRRRQRGRSALARSPPPSPLQLSQASVVVSPNLGSPPAAAPFKCPSGLSAGAVPLGALEAGPGRRAPRVRIPPRAGRGRLAFTQRGPQRLRELGPGRRVWRAGRLGRGRGRR
ncbi:hypothetical protein J1605_008940 [Eschrichtius robustus]|uniref:Uncharacterized protein n=1 Tax=Eschrichtius robustus TaxID=9764 RepID=A0AB34GXL1_ESCRO|nr:hypothetical protein J1605_008940 [Eschrichtius robustus]